MKRVGKRGAKPKEPVARPAGKKAARLPAWRRRLVLASWLLAAVAICVRAAQIQVLQAAHWRGLAESQHRDDMIVPAARGSILDRDGAPLAVSRERVRVSVAPKELEDVGEARTALREELGLSRTQADRLTSRERAWAVAPDLHAPDVRERLRTVRGVHLERVLQRHHPHGELARLQLSWSSLETISVGLLRDEILRSVRSAGFRFVAIDLDEGVRGTTD